MEKFLAKDKSHVSVVFLPRQTLLAHTHNCVRPAVG
jgi:hypothetical protein